MFKVTCLLCCLAAMALPTAAFGDGIDPAMTAEGTQCGTGLTGWCLSSGIALDPVSGIDTIEYVFNSKIPSVTDGDVDIRQGSLSGSIVDLLRFENIGGDAVVFIYSDDIVGSLAADVPGSSYDTVVSIVENIGSYTLYPSSGSLGAANPGYSATGEANSYGTYGLNTTDVVPEPSSVVLFGSILILAAGALRRRIRCDA
jgi:hypothetical protein